MNLPAKTALVLFGANEVGGLIRVGLSAPVWAPFVSPWTIALTFAAVGMTLGLWSLWRTLTANVSQAIARIEP